jgi:hypothetical protein
MNSTSESSDAYYYAAAANLPTSYYSQVEERCEHLEELTCSTLELLQEVIKDFHSPGLNPLLSGIMERLNSIVAFIETELASLRSLDEDK